MMMTDLACAPSWKPNDRDRVVVSDRLAADAHGALAIFATDSKSRLEDGRKHQHPGRPRAEFPGPRNLAVKPVERGVDRSVDSPAVAAFASPFAASNMHAAIRAMPKAFPVI